jgi:hypothetical protein
LFINSCQIEPVNEIKTATIQAGQILKARSACDQNCIFEVKVLARKGAFVTVKAEGIVRRVKVMNDSEGEFVFAMGRYSMAPIFRASMPLVVKIGQPVRVTHGMGQREDGQISDIITNGAGTAYEITTESGVLEYTLGFVVGKEIGVSLI